MKISCPTCQAKYSIADEKVQSRLAKIRCRKCGTSIVIDGNVNPPSVYAGEAGDAGEAAQEPSGEPMKEASTSVYTVDFGEGDQRQLGVSEIVSAYNAGTITAQTYVWAEGFADWMALGEVDAIVQALHAAAGHAAPAPVDSSAAAALSTAPSETPWAAPAKAAAAAPTGADLFGNYDRAGSEQEVSTSTARGNVANPFGAGASANASGTGARNESSVLFSLSALTSASTTSRPSVPAPSAPSASGGTSEDSGLIDLKALTAAAEAQARPLPAAAPILAPSPLGAPAPLGVPSPLGSPLSAASAAEPSIPPKKNNAGLFIIGGFILIGLIGGAAVFATMSKGDPAPPAPAAATPTAAAITPAPLPTSAPLPTADAKPPSTGTETEPAPSGGTVAKKPTTGTTATKKPTTTSSSSSSTSSTTSSTTTTKPPAKSGGSCGCKSGDLMCEIACSSKSKKK